MADNFDAVQITYDIIKTCGVSVFQDRILKDQAGEYVVVGSNACNNLPAVNVAQVNVNIYIPRSTNGMPNRTRLEAVRTSILTLIGNATAPAGYYCVIDQIFSALLNDVREGYDCFTIRLELTLNNTRYVS